MDDQANLEASVSVLLKISEFIEEKKKNNEYVDPAKMHSVKIIQQSMIQHLKTLCKQNK
jgi:hypothetical protein